MSGEILLRAEDARTAADDVTKAAGDAQSAIENLRSRLSQLEGSFRGQTATAFDNKYNEWHAGAKQMLEGLDGLGQFLRKAADTIEQADTDIASQLNG
jgi:WXG100 family type VII secretion target